MRRSMSMLCAHQGIPGEIAEFVHATVRPQPALITGSAICFMHAMSAPPLGSAHAWFPKSAPPLGGAHAWFPNGAPPLGGAHAWFPKGWRENASVDL